MRTAKNVLSSLAIGQVRMIFDALQSEDVADTPHLMAEIRLYGDQAGITIV